MPQDDAKEVTNSPEQQRIVEIEDLISKQLKKISRS